MPHTVNVVAVQPVVTGNDPEATLEDLERLVRAAVSEHDPDLVVLPAGLTVGNRSAERIPAAVRPVDGAPLQLLRLLSRELGVTVAGGFHARRGRDAVSTYAAVDPDGCTHLSNASSLLPEEARWCAPGDAPQLTRIGTTSAGMLTGLQWAEQTSSRRLTGKVRLVFGGLSWPTAGPSSATTTRMWTGHNDAATLDRYVGSLAMWQARLFGAPTILAVHGRSAHAPGIGATQIVNADGGVVASMPAHDGEGYVAAQLTLPTEVGSPRHALVGRWIGPGPGRVAFESAVGRAALSYQRDRLAHRHPWQHWPGADLPDESGPAPAHSLAHATTFDWKAS